MEYNITVEKINEDSKEKTYDSSGECLNITLEEYRHVTERANKFDNKVYIMITFCSIFFAFIISLLDKIINLSLPENTKSNIAFIVCIVFFIIIGISYMISMIILVLELRPLKLHRFNPKQLIDYSLWNKSPAQANMLAVKQYTEFILANNQAIEKSYKKLDAVTILMSIVVVLGFIEYTILIFL